MGPESGVPDNAFFLGGRAHKKQTFSRLGCERGEQLQWRRGSVLATGARLAIHSVYTPPPLAQP